MSHIICWTISFLLSWTSLKGIKSEKKLINWSNSFSLHRFKGCYSPENVMSVLVQKFRHFHDSCHIIQYIQQIWSGIMQILTLGVMFRKNSQKMYRRMGKLPLQGVPDVMSLYFNCSRLKNNLIFLHKNDWMW